MLTLQQAKNIHGKLDLPPSSDLFILTAVVALSRQQAIHISPLIDTPFLREWEKYLEGHITFEWKKEGCTIVPVRDDPSRRIGFDTYDIPWRDLIVFTLLGMGKTIVFRSITERRCTALQEQAQRIGCTLLCEPYESSTCLSLADMNSVPSVPQPLLNENDIHPLLGLLLGKKSNGTFTITTALSSPLRSISPLFGFSIEVRSLIAKERDPIARRLQLMQQKSKTSGIGQQFTVTADFTSPPTDPDTPLPVTLPGDELMGAVFTAAKCLFPKSSLIINNLLLETWATPLFAFIRKMGCKVSVQETGRCSYGSVGILHIQSAALIGRKMECVPAVLYFPFLPTMVVIAAHAEGESVFRELEDLRYDEPDGIEFIESCIDILGARHGSMPDGIVLKGGRVFDGFDLTSSLPASFAAAFAIAGLRCVGTTTVNDEQLQKRLPQFETILQKICEFRK